MEKSNPELVKEWNYEKNGDLKPTQVTAGSNKKFGGNVQKGMNGKRQSQVEGMVVVAHIVQMSNY